MPCQLDAPDVGKHLKDHLQVALVLPGAGRGRVDDRGRHLAGSRRAPRSERPVAGRSGRRRRPCPPSCRRSSTRPSGASPSGRPPDAASCRRRSTTRAPGSRPASATTTPTTRRSASSAAATTATSGAGACASTPTSTSTTPPSGWRPTPRAMIVLANPVQPHSEGEIVLASADPAVHPDIRMNYFDDPHDMAVMVAVLRRALDVVANWPGHREIGPLTGPARARREARPRRRRHAERRPARGPRPPLLLDRVPPDIDLPDRQRGRRPRCGSLGVGLCASPTRASCRTS